MATLDAYLEAFEDGVAVPDATTVAMLREQTSRLARLAEDVSAVSLAEEHRLALHPVDVSPQELVNAALSAAADRYEEAGVILSDGSTGVLPPVRVDRDRIGQVLGNLLDNALQHTPRGGTVCVAASASSGRVQVTVTDTGTGIPAEHLPHVFERFYRVDEGRDRAHGGSGIGLAIAKALVEAHDGQISAASLGSGTGSRFTITLPTAGVAATRSGG